MHVLLLCSVDSTWEIWSRIFSSSYARLSELFYLKTLLVYKFDQLIGSAMIMACRACKAGRWLTGRLSRRHIKNGSGILERGSIHSSHLPYYMYLYTTTKFV